MTLSPLLAVPRAQLAENVGTELSETAIADEKDRLLGKAYDLDETRVLRLALAIWTSATPHDFTQHAIAAIHPHHNTASRGRAIAALTDCSPKTGERIHKSETQHADTWPLMITGILPFLTYRGAVAYVSAAAGMDADKVDALLRRHLGQERAR